MSSSSLPIVSTPISGRPRSVRSVASNSSIASSTSTALRRRSRTRTRSRTVTGSAGTRPEGHPPGPFSDLPFVDKYPPHPSDTLLPPHSLNVATSSRSLTSQEADSAVGEVTLVAALPQQSPIPAKLSKAARQASHLASIETSYNPALSAFSRDPELTPNVRDSISTQKSSTCSSFYPPSTSTISGPESPTSPLVTAEEELSQQPNISLLTEGVDEMQEYDGDDVAYRLRLLVNNNYFLPPAHMKPSPEDFAASMNAKKPQKHSAPTFLDIFRVGKSKSKPTTPVTPGFGVGPILRTTSDSITPSYVRRPQTRTPQPSHLSAHPMNGNIDRGRVVVVRERMNNIAVAAKQAEQEMKTRNARREQGSERGRQPQLPLESRDVGDVIDPTDAVDIPLLASNYPFAVQASALHGLGVQESVGAAILADRLPPTSPNMSLYEPDDWRKALLREVVHHSLDHTPDESTFSHVPGTSTPMLASQRVNGESSRSTTPGTRTKRLQQRIADPQTSLEVENVEDPPQESNLTKNDPIRKSQSRPSTAKSAGKFLATPESNDSRRSSYLPVRAITPIANLTPLSPAPRRPLFSVTYSMSQTDLHQHSIDGETPGSELSAKSRLRRSMSTPMLSEAHDSMRQQFVMTPPPPPIPSTRRSSQMTVLTQSYETGREMPSRASAFSSHSHFDDSEELIRRGSPRLSALGNRPSMSSYSQVSLSPTTSAFQEALNHTGDQSTASSMHRNSVERASTEEERRTRSSLASPPPRPSTSLAHIALRPPPRSSSFNYPNSALGRLASSSEPRIEISAPSPTRQHPYSRLRDVNTIPLTLEIPSVNAEVEIHSPAPSSPTSFFDTLQAQPNAMDDLDSSDESEDEDEGEGEEDEVTQSPPPPPPPPLPQSPPPYILDPRARANSTVAASPIRPNTFMRLGNFSTPYVGRGANERFRTLPIGVVDPKKALGFTPVKTPFFSERKSDLGHGNELTTLLVQAQARGREVNSLGQALGVAGASGTSAAATVQSAAAGPSTEGGEKRRPATAGQVNLSSVALQHKPEALKKLDGMMVQHMEAEKDRMRKIASALKSESQLNLPGTIGESGTGW
ncbi:hypothetical protein P691DRAFT_810524 [Macrolepiota fuliginosa MF-IS2]|uniref:Uncharacterized protein n=1 Tax=Macrolepiota fuliginosa MF-IS2 TaxID=1400762 RepID=A0A9P5XG41_9AGAR|nr:hypothetical protein P691DRAFT_810524 [Macrolepiota fuliginosa MF-IS2]